MAAGIQYYGTGRRKTSTARVFLRPGTGGIVINRKPIEQAFPTEALRTQIKQPLAVTELMLATKELISTTFQPFPLYIAAAGIYWVLSLAFEQVQRALERRLAFPH